MTTLAGVFGLIANDVIGFQTAGTSFAANLDQMAAVGGTGLMTHTSVSSEQELNEVLDRLIGSAASCKFKLEQAPSDPALVRISLDGTPLVLDDADGFKLSADGVEVEVTGKPCQELQSRASSHQLDVKVKCPPPVIR